MPEQRASVPMPVPAPLEAYACASDDVFHTVIQRRRFREDLAGFLLPRDRTKTLTALVGAEPITQAQTAPVQQLQWVFSESAWEAEAVNARRIARLPAEAETAAHAGACSSSTRRAIARTAPRRRTSPATTWGRSARSPTASSP